MIAGPVIVGVDGSPESQTAAAAGWRVAQAAEVGCHLVHACADVRSSLDLAGTGVAVDDVQSTVLDRARSQIIATLTDTVPPQVLNDLIVRVGRPTKVLTDLVEETHAGMVVLGGKHHSALGRWLGGSTVQHAVRRLSVPLLVTAGELPPRPRVLVAVDLSYAALPTLDQAVDFTRLLGSPLRALHVLEPIPNTPELPFPVDASVFETEARDLLDQQIWPALPVPDHHKVVRHGGALDTIAQEGVAWRADVIVVGSHGKGWVDRLIIGSLTEDLLNNLPAAVLVIPVPAPERPEMTPLYVAGLAVTA